MQALELQLAAARTSASEPPDGSGGSALAGGGGADANVRTLQLRAEAEELRRQVEPI